FAAPSVGFVRLSRRLRASGDAHGRGDSRLSTVSNAGIHGLAFAAPPTLDARFRGHDGHWLVNKTFNALPTRHTSLPPRRSPSPLAPFPAREGGRRCSEPRVSTLIPDSDSTN